MKNNSLIYPLVFIFAILSLSGFAVKQNDSAVNLVVKLDNIEAGTVTLSQVANVSTVTAAVINAKDGTPIDYAVNSFTFTISHMKDSKEAIQYSEDTKGDQLTKPMKARLAALRPGDIITIKNVKATSPQNASVTYGSTNWQIVPDPSAKQK